MKWIIVWAGLFIAVLYSPIGSPDLYNSQNYYIESHSANFSNNVIPNASKVRFIAENNTPEPDMPDMNSSGLHTTLHGTGNSQTAQAPSPGSSYSGSQVGSFQNNSPSSPGGINGGGISIIAGSGSRSSAGSSGIILTNGMASISTTTLSTTNTTTRQLANQTLTGGTDPGGDPTGDPIPVGDGWGLLILFGACYAVMKRVFPAKEKSVLSPHKKN